MTKRKKFIIALGIFLLLLIIGRLLLPGFVVRHLNKTLEEIPNYTGYVHDVQISLISGSYAIDSLFIFHEAMDRKLPFFASPRINLSIQWNEVFNGALVGEIEMLHPELNFVVYQSGDTTAIQTGEEADWTEPLKAMLPIQINELRGARGRISFVDSLAQPPVNIYLDSLNFMATNISNTTSEDVLPSEIHATGTSIGGGALELSGRMNALKRIPDMDLELVFEGAELTSLNNFTLAYAELDTESGTFNCYSELVVADGIMEGYVKPVLDNIKILDFSEDKKKPLQMIWEAVAGMVIELFENQKQDQFATQVPLEGDLNEVQSSIWPVLGGIFKNAFIQAFTKSTSGDISFDEVVDSK